MHNDPLGQWRHDHVFEQDTKRAGEARTLIVVAITAVMMVIEIIAGLVYGGIAATKKTHDAMVGPHGRSI